MGHVRVVYVYVWLCIHMTLFIHTSVQIYYIIYTRYSIDIISNVLSFQELNSWLIVMYSQPQHWKDLKRESFIQFSYLMGYDLADGGIQHALDPTRVYHDSSSRTRAAGRGGGDWDGGTWGGRDTRARQGDGRQGGTGAPDSQRVIHTAVEVD